MGKPVDQKIKETEATALNALIEAIHPVSLASFAKNAGITGGRSMVHQHTHAIKPISIEAAKKYADALGCRIAEFSPRIAELIGQPTDSIGYATHEKITKLEVKERSARDALIEELTVVARTMSERGIAELIGRAKEIASQHPAQANPVNFSSSQH
jgi:hypothetical protein